MSADRIPLSRCSPAVASMKLPFVMIWPWIVDRPDSAWITTSTALRRLLGPVAPNAESDTWMMRGLHAVTAPRPSPIDSAASGCSVWMNTSAVRIRRRARSRPSARRRSTAKDLLLRLNVSNTQGTRVRVKSPRPGFSSLMTSAPRSASNLVHELPARPLLRSITRNPSSAFGTVASPCCVVLPVVIGCSGRSDARPGSADLQAGWGEVRLTMNSW